SPKLLQLALEGRDLGAKAVVLRADAADEVRQVLGRLALERGNAPLRAALEEDEEPEHERDRRDRELAAPVAHRGSGFDGHETGAPGAALTGAAGLEGADTGRARVY